MRIEVDSKEYSRVSVKQIHFRKPKMRIIIVASVLCSIVLSISSVLSHQRWQNESRNLNQVKKNRTRAAKVNSLFWAASNVELPRRKQATKLNDESRAIVVAESKTIQTRINPIRRNDVAKISRSNESLPRKMRQSGERLSCLTG